MVIKTCLQMKEGAALIKPFILFVTSLVTRQNLQKLSFSSYHVYIFVQFCWQDSLGFMSPVKQTTPGRRTWANNINYLTWTVRTWRSSSLIYNSINNEKYIKYVNHWTTPSAASTFLDSQKSAEKYLQILYVNNTQYWSSDDIHFLKEVTNSQNANYFLGVQFELGLITFVHWGSQKEPKRP